MAKRFNFVQSANMEDNQEQVPGLDIELTEEVAEVYDKFCL